MLALEKMRQSQQTTGDAVIGLSNMINPSQSRSRKTLISSGNQFMKIDDNEYQTKDYLDGKKELENEEDQS